MFFPLPSPLHFFFGSFLAHLPFVFPLSSHFLRVIPSLKHYSDIVSDIPCWKYTWHIFILALHLTFFLAYTLTFYLTFCLAYFLTYFLAYVLTFILAFFLASILTFSSSFNFGILFGIYSDILSGICIHIHSNSKKIEPQFATNLVGFYKFLSFFWGAGPAYHLAAWRDHWPLAAKAQSGCSRMAPRGSKAGDPGGTVPHGSVGANSSTNLG